MALRTHVAAPLTEIVLDGIEIVNVDALRERIKQASIPARRGGSFDVLRSDLGEVLGYELLEQEYQTRIAYKSVRDRELPQLPGRGIDAIGVELDAGADGRTRLRLVIGEVKVSDENRSPPQVVDTGEQSLRAQHRGHMADRGLTVSKVFQQAQRTVDTETRDLLFAAGLLLEAEDWERVRVIACSTLVRSRARCTDHDCGSFYDSPGDYAPATVRFLTIELPEDVEATVAKWVAKINSLETAA